MVQLNPKWTYIIAVYIFLIFPWILQFFFFKNSYLNYSFHLYYFFYIKIKNLFIFYFYYYFKLILISNIFFNLVPKLKSWFCHCKYINIYFLFVYYIIIKVWAFSCTLMLQLKCFCEMFCMNNFSSALK